MAFDAGLMPWKLDLQIFIPLGRSHARGRRSASSLTHMARIAFQLPLLFGVWHLDLARVSLMREVAVIRLLLTQRHGQRHGKKGGEEHEDDFDSLKQHDAHIKNSRQALRLHLQLSPNLGVGLGVGAAFLGK